LNIKEFFFSLARSWQNRGRKVNFGGDWM